MSRVNVLGCLIDKCRLKLFWVWRAKADMCLGRIGKQIDQNVFVDCCFVVCLPSRPSMSEVPCRKRDDYLEWPEYFMAVAFLSAQRSKDPNSQVREFCRRMFGHWQTWRCPQVSRLQKEEAPWTPANLEKQSQSAVFCTAFLPAHIFLWESKLPHTPVYCLSYPKDTELSAPPEAACPFWGSAGLWSDWLPLQWQMGPSKSSSLWACFPTGWCLHRECRK